LFNKEIGQFSGIEEERVTRNMTDDIAAVPILEDFKAILKSLIDENVPTLTFNELGRRLILSKIGIKTEIAILLFLKCSYFCLKHLYCNIVNITSKKKIMTKPPIALFIFSNNVDKYLHNIENEKKQIRQALEQYHDTNRMTVIMEAFTSIDELIRLFQRYHGQIALFHFSGHAGGKGLQLNQNITDTDTAYAKGIAGLIQKEVEKGQLKLVFLNGCSTAPQVEALKAAGVNSIIATNFPIDDKKATHFSAHFYRTMANTAKDDPFAEKPITIQQAFHDALNYLNTNYKNSKTQETHRGFTFNDDAVSYEEPWELFTMLPEWHLPNKPIKVKPLAWFVALIGIPILILIGVYFWYENNLMKTPIDLKVILKDKIPNGELPEIDAIISIMYKGKEETFEEITDEITFPNLFRSKTDKVKLTFKAKGFIDRDTTFILTKGIEFPIWRDDYYANIMGKVVDGNGSPVQGAKVTVQDITKLTDDIGNFKITLPTNKQRQTQRIDIYKEGYDAKNTSSPVMPNETMRFILDEN
jgi:DNA-binding NarL/FixJ family response regulator